MGERQERIAAAIAAELDRQGAAQGQRLGEGIDQPALAAAIERTLVGGGLPGEAPLEGRTPDKLNSSNDG